MRRYWWLVWVKVAVLAVALLLAYFFVSERVDAILSPYTLDEPREPTVQASDDETDNPLDRLVFWVEEKLDVQLDYEQMIFDYANDYAKEMIRQSDEERSLTNE